MLVYTDKDKNCREDENDESFISYDLISIHYCFN